MSQNSENRPAGSVEQPGAVPVDLDWLAFRYAACEMPLEEAARFERLLADDQPARESLARAVELAGALRILAEHERPVVPAAHRPERSPKAVAGWMSLGAAICLAILAAGTWGLGLWNVPADGPAPGVVQRGVDDPWNSGGAELAVAWAETTGSDLFAESSGWEPAEAPVEEMPIDELPIDEEETNVVDVPGWLVAAVYEERGRERGENESNAPDDEDDG